MTESERTLKRIEALLVRLVAILDPKPKAKPKSAASVVSVTRLPDGTVTSDDGLIPRQLTAEQEQAQRWQARPHRVSPGAKSDTRPVSERSGRVR